MIIEVEVGGRRFRWYDAQGEVLCDNGIIGHIDAGQLKLWRYDADEERDRSFNRIRGRLLALALAYTDRLAARHLAEFFRRHR